MSTFKDMHKYYNNCYTDNLFDDNKLLEYFDNNSYYSSEKRVEILKEVYETVLNISFINEFSKEYIRNPHITIRDVVDNYNITVKKEEDKVNESTGRSRIIYCSQRINKVFKDIEYEREKYSIITWVFKKKTAFNENGYNEELNKIDNEFLRQLKEFKDTYSKVKYKKNKKDLIISLPEVTEVKEIEDDEFDNFMDILRPYSKNQINIVQSVINNMEKEVGYYNYLMNNTELSEKDIERKEDIIRWLGLDNE